ncbi:MAG: hypothetical protein ACPGNP_13360, partial [Acidimicrobiales bacterium]
AAVVGVRRRRQQLDRSARRVDRLVEGAVGGEGAAALHQAVRSWRLIATVAYVLACCHLFLVARAWLGLGEYVLTGETYRDVPGAFRPAALVGFVVIIVAVIWQSRIDGLRYAVGWGGVALAAYTVMVSAVFFPALVRNVITWIICTVVIVTMSFVLRSMLKDAGFGPERLRQAWFASLIWLAVATVIIGAWLLSTPWGIVGHAFAAYSYIHMGGQFVDVVTFLVRLFVVPAFLYVLWEWVYTKASRF